MNTRFCGYLLVLGLSLTGTTAWSQFVVSYAPVTQAVVPVVTNSVVYRPVTTVVPVASAIPVVTYRMPLATYAPVVSDVAGTMATFSPITTYPVIATFSPVTDDVDATPFAPVTLYRPVVASVPVGPAVVIRPKVYVAGEPIRNFFRAITP